MGSGNTMINNSKKYALALLSTGLDSPVASYLMMKKGYDIIALSFLNGGEESQKNGMKVIEVARKLKELTHQEIILYTLDYDTYLDKIIEKCDRKNTCLFCKRTMLKTAALLAQMNNCEFIINGDILGEQASQTLDNLFVVSESNRKVPIIRPLIGFDKSDIIQISRKVGLYELTLINAPGCIKNPKYPETHAKLEEILDNEKNLDLNINSLIEKSQKIEF